MLLVACATGPKSYSLKSISNVEESDRSQKKVTAFVELNRYKPNRISVFNWETYTLFNVYKKIGDAGKFNRYAELYAGKKPDISALVTQFTDIKSSSLSDRYEIRPVVNGNELNALPIEYQTNDSLYYKEFELNK